ncbi:MAG: KH domain-containing protein [Patescibacteria group bacterium]|nr:KH domain-containing protein [Patescibacteria group bacterium]
MDKKQNKIVQDTTEELLKLLEIEGDFEVTQTEDAIEINLNTQDSGIVIGYHGDTLESLQLILSLCLAKKLGEFKRVSIEVGEYKKKREEWLRNLASETREKVVSENKEVYLSDLKAWERRVVHLILQNDQEVVSESVGEGKDRVLVVKPKN